MKRMIEVDKDPRKDKRTAQYSEKQRYEAVVLYKMIGNLTNVAKHMGIPVQTLHLWHTQDWWNEAEEEIRVESRSKLGKNLQGIVDKAFKEVEDRLENGDWIYDQKQGKMIRKPLGGHTVNQILKDSLDKTFFLEKLKKEEKKDVNQEQISETLLKLAKEFERFTKSRTIEATEVSLALHDERQAGLQEGEPPLQVETGANRQASSPEQGTQAVPEGREGPQG